MPPRRLSRLEQNRVRLIEEHSAAEAQFVYDYNLKANTIIWQHITYGSGDLPRDSLGKPLSTMAPEETFDFCDLFSSAVDYTVSQANKAEAIKAFEEYKQIHNEL